MKFDITTGSQTSEISKSSLQTTHIYNLISGNDLTEIESQLFRTLSQNECTDGRLNFSDHVRQSILQR